MRTKKPKLTSTSFTSAHVHNFVKTFLWAKYDEPVPIPEFHHEMWNAILGGHSQIARAAPRYHAKSTSVTFALTLFLFLFRVKKYGLLVSNTIDQSSLFLGDIKAELLENEPLREAFGIREVIKDAVTDLIVQTNDGHQFRIQALGAEQKVRGRKWRNKRPDYIVCDDLEEDEQVESEDRREKFRKWFNKALLPCLSKSGQIIVVGTILHLDALLMRLMSNEEWNSKLYRAHKGFDDFRERLWPEQWTEEKLKKIRKSFVADGNAEGYSQEYLNDPISHSEAFFKKEDIKDLEEEQKKLPTSNYAGVDLAISDEDRSAFTVIVVGGMDEFRRLIIKQVVRFRGDANEIITQMLEVQRLYDIELWKVEQGQISKTLMGPLYEAMEESQTYLNIVPGVPTKDKRSRARAIQARMRAGGVYADKREEWYPAFEQELIQFPKGPYKDQVDAAAWLGIALQELAAGPTSQEQAEDDYDEQMEDYEPSGMSYVTGY